MSSMQWGYLHKQQRCNILPALRTGVLCFGSRIHYMLAVPCWDIFSTGIFHDVPGMLGRILHKHQRVVCMHAVPAGDFNWALMKMVYFCFNTFNGYAS